MPEINFLPIVVAALVPMILGAIYYGPLFGKQWFDSLGKTEEEMTPNNMPVTYGLALLMALILSFTINFFIEFMRKSCNEAGEIIFASDHTFGHGAFHGMFFGLLAVVPVIVSLSLFHKMSAKSIILNTVFWTLCLAIMGGITDVWN